MALLSIQTGDVCYYVMDRLRLPVIVTDRLLNQLKVLLPTNIVATYI